MATENAGQIGTKSGCKSVAIWCAKINLKIYFTRVAFTYDSAQNGHRKWPAIWTENCKEIVGNLGAKNKSKDLFHEGGIYGENVWEMVLENETKIGPKKVDNLSENFPAISGNLETNFQKTNS